uniref:Uncharacterized protein n=1 Tax=Onchocerca volvulus TaxID=6282 RepID=A0A8R1XVR5_ONCVO
MSIDKSHCIVVVHCAAELYSDIQLISAYRNSGAMLLLSNINNPPTRFTCSSVQHTKLPAAYEFFDKSFDEAPL